MLRYFATIVGIAAALQAEPGAADAFHALLLPGVVVACMIMVIGATGTAIIGFGVIMWRQMDVTGPGAWESVAAPLLLVGDVLTLLLWAWRRGYLEGGGGDGGGFDGGFDGGDGGD